MEFGVAHYISKPWHRGTIEATIEVALREVGRSSEDAVDPCGLMISTGSQPSDEKLGGGLPLGSSTMLEGAPPAIRSVLRKLCNAEPVSGNIVRFEVQPGMGIPVSPMFNVKV